MAKGRPSDDSLGRDAILKLCDAIEFGRSSVVLQDSLLAEVRMIANKIDRPLGYVADSETVPPGTTLTIEDTTP